MKLSKTLHALLPRCDIWRVSNLELGGHIIQCLCKVLQSGLKLLMSYQQEIVEGYFLLVHPVDIWSCSHLPLISCDILTFL